MLGFIVAEAADLYESGTYGLPSEKYTLLKTIAFGLYLMDGSAVSKLSIYKNKSLNLARYDAIFAVRRCMLSFQSEPGPGASDRAAVRRHVRASDPLGQAVAKL